MIVRKKYIPLATLLFLLLLAGCQCNTKNKQAEPATIEIAIKNGASTKITVEHVTTEDIIETEAVTTDNKGRATVRLLPSEEEILLLRFDNNAFIPLVIDKNRAFRVSAEYPDIASSFEVQGTPEAVALTAYFKRLFSDIAKSDSLAALLNAHKDTPLFATVRDKSVSEFQSIYESLRAFSDSILKAHPEYLSSLLILNQSIGQRRLYNQGQDTALYFLVDKSLTTRIPGNKHVVAFHKTITEYKQGLAAKKIAGERLSPGNKAPEFSLPDASGTWVNLSDFQGKPVLLAFWNSREDGTSSNLPMLKTMYDDYKKLGFEIIAVSMDTNETVWKNSIAAQNVSWVNVSDLKGTTSPLVRLYNLQEKLPVYYLIGRDGAILAQNPSMMEADDILYSLQQGNL